MDCTKTGCRCLCTCGVVHTHGTCPCPCSCGQKQAFERQKQAIESQELCEVGAHVQFEDPYPVFVGLLLPGFSSLLEACVLAPLFGTDSFWRHATYFAIVAVVMALSTQWGLGIRSIPKWTLLSAALRLADRWAIALCENKPERPCMHLIWSIELGCLVAVLWRLATDTSHASDFDHAVGIEDRERPKFGSYNLYYLLSVFSIAIPLSLFLHFQVRAIETSQPELYTWQVAVLICAFTVALFMMIPLVMYRTRSE